MVNRREFVKGCVAGAGGLALSGFVTTTNGVKQGSNKAPYIRNSKIHDKVIVLGLDGMDPTLTAQMMAEGELPAFSRLRELGCFGPLGTTLPPQSPVAWSSFITGTNPGGHGIYDFIHRDPKTLMPYLSTSKSIAGDSNLNIGKYSIPLDSGRVDLMRQGVPFWKTLERAEIPAIVTALPANFPVMQESKKVRALSGMGTPDLLGGYGTYTYFTERPVEGSKDFTGGRVVVVRMRDHSFESEIWGPQNPFVDGNPRTSTPVKISRDPVTDTVRIDIGSERRVLRQGEWSDWVPVSFELLPLVASTSGMVRFFAKKVHGGFLMYVTPVNIDPMNPALPICTPDGYSRELAEKVGRFYTQGLPADTKALNEGVLTSEEFFQQSKIVFQESLDMFDYQFGQFKEGCFVFYFSSLDQNSHMLWRCMDSKHPLYEEKASKEVKSAIRWYYQQADKVVAQALDRLDSRTLLLAISDHGFTTFTREFNLSTWLVEEGYISLTQPKKMEEMRYFDYVDWQRTRAYPIGINGLYLNLKGREKHGSLDPSVAKLIKREIASKLTEIRDSQNGEKIIRAVYDADQAYSGNFKDLAPDLVIGYERGYRVSDESILGGFPRGIIRDRTKAWSADHCMDPKAMPGVFFANKECQNSDRAIWDMAPTILAAFGLTPDSPMDGKSVLA